MTTRFEVMYRARLDTGKYVCVGLDPDFSQIPDAVSGDDDPEIMLEFVKGIVDATHHVAAAYKLQSAYYEALGHEGIQVLKKICAYIRVVDSTIPIILDYKRGDIGRTSEQYVQAAFGRMSLDAVTVNPYMGMEAMKPFLEQADRHIFVLGKTSNTGGGEFQDVLCSPVLDMDTAKYYASDAEAKREGADWESLIACDKMPLYQFVALRVARNWNYNGNCGLVVGATKTEQLGLVRRLVDDMLILVPGIGTQGGDLEGSIRVGRGREWLALAFNNSSAIMYAFKKSVKPTGGPWLESEWMEAANVAAGDMNNAVAALL